MHAVAIARNGGPIAHFGAGSEDALLFVGAKKIGAGGIEEGNVAQGAAGERLPF